MPERNNNWGPLPQGDGHAEKSQAATGLWKAVPMDPSDYTARTAVLASGQPSDRALGNLRVKGLAPAPPYSEADQWKSNQPLVKQAVRTFETGATRSSDVGKHDPFGYESALVRKRFAEYMTKHRVQPDGTTRASDNWKRGMPATDSVRSLTRHVLDVQLYFEGYPDEAVEPIEEALSAVIFNAQSMLLEVLKEKRQRRLVDSILQER